MSGSHALSKNTRGRSLQKAGAGAVVPAMHASARPFGVVTVLGAGRVDPFASYPIRVEPYMQRLVDFRKCISYR